VSINYNSLIIKKGLDTENLKNLLLMISEKYAVAENIKDQIEEFKIQDPETFPDLGIWHPLAPCMFESLREYQNWENNRKDINPKDDKTPTIGLVLQRSHIVTGDDAHYVAVIQELEYRGARVLPIFCGGLDFSKPVNEFYYDSINKDQPIVDGVVSLTGFALVGGPARQDHPKAIEALKRLNRPYMVALPLVFQTTQEWEDSDLGLHPVQVALQIAIPELDGAIEPIILSGRDDATGKAHTLQDRVDVIAERAIKWSTLRVKQRKDKKLAITVFSFPPDKGNVGTAAYLNVFGSIYRVLLEMKSKGYQIDELPSNSKEKSKFLFKDEVRKLGLELNLSREIISRHPFPGPGLAIRMPGIITKEKINILKEADHYFIQALRDHNLYHKIWQAYAALLPVKTVGVMGDNRTYEYLCLLRAITSEDGMTADFYEFKKSFIQEISNKIVNSIRGINRVVYDITSKPPSTIELE